jgi:hypothetical protein
LTGNASTTTKKPRRSALFGDSQTGEQARGGLPFLHRAAGFETIISARPNSFFGCSRISPSMPAAAIDRLLFESRLRQSKTGKIRVRYFYDSINNNPVENRNAV